MLHFISISRYFGSRAREERSVHTIRAVPSDRSEPLRKSLFWRGVILLLFCLAASGHLLNAGSLFDISAQDLSRQAALCVVVAFVCISLNFVASAIYLARRNPEADALAAAAVRFAVLSSTGALVLGMALTHRQLNVWWLWKAGDTTSFFALIIYVGYLMLRKLCDPGRAPLIASVFAMFAFVDIPFICVAVRLRLSGTARLSRLLAPDVVRVLCRPPQLWNALSSLALIALAVAAEYRLLSIHQKSEERSWAQRSSGFEN